MKKRLLKTALLLLALCSTVLAQAQLSRLADTLLYRNEIKGTLSGGDFTPYWMVNNQYGLTNPDGNTLLWRRSVSRSILNDQFSERNWQVGYGLEFSTLFGKDSRHVIQELYADVQYKKVRLSIGQKMRPCEGLNPELSSGGLASGINCRPLPQVRLEVPEFWEVKGTDGWLALKGHIGYGAYMDNGWQRDFASGSKALYTEGSLYHTKAGFLRLGNAYKFPLTLTGGLEMNTQFGGTAYNVKRRADDFTDFQGGTVKMPRDLKAFWRALSISGSDATDAGYSNASGNTVGAWHLALDIHGLDWAGDQMWKARLYAQHQFEDHSQFFWQYGWKDMLWGFELNLPRHWAVTDVVYEYLSTKDQSGPIYHDATPQIPDQVSAVDNYYNHGVYGAWQHAGFGMGNGLLISPVYNNEGRIGFCHNRIEAHHFGLRGQPIDDLSYRLLFSYEKSWGTYSLPLTDPQEGWTVFVETTYRPHWLRHCGLALGYGHNGGRLFHNSNAVQISFQWDHKFFKKEKK